MGVTIRDVAKLAGVSVTSVSAALNGTSGKTIRVGAATREKIYAAAAQVGYISNPVAKSLATGRTKVLGLILPYSDAFLDQNPFCHELMAGIMREVVHDQYNLMLYTASSGIHTDETAALIDSRIDGLLLVMPPEKSPTYEKCVRLGIPYISVLKAPAPGEWTVNADDYDGGRRVGEHLISLGHRKIGHLKGGSEVVTSEPRCRGFRDAISEAGITIREEWFVSSGMDWRMGMNAMERILSLGPKNIPTAVFAVNDLCAEGAIRAVRAAGLSVPNDIAVVGFDDTWYATLTQPPLTTVHMPIQEMGEIAARMLIRRIEGDTDIDTKPVLPVSLTVRRSCGAPESISSPETPKSPIATQRGTSQ
jgi:LacI family transcriptional regulator